MKAIIYYSMSITALAVTFAGCTPGPAPQPKAVVKVADQQLQEARKKLQQEDNATSEIAWKLGQACFQRAEFAKDDTERARLALEGIDACRKLVAAEPDNVGGHYYLAMNLGQMCRVKQLQALGMVKDMERHFNRARDLDERFSHAGPDRNLGLLYFRAPRFISVGDKEKAMRHLRRAAELAPDYPANRLNLLEALIDAGDQPGVERERAVLQKMLPAAREKFQGDEWAADWLDWDQRWPQLRGDQ